MMIRLKALMKRLESLLWAKRNYKFLVQHLEKAQNIHEARQLLNSQVFGRYLKPLLLPPPSGKSILVVAPHPDDEIIGPGGTLIMANQQECHLRVAYLTKGSKTDHSVRLAESHDICAALECGQIVENNLAGDTNWSCELLTQAIKKSRPDIIMLPFFLDDHPEHRKANEVLLNIWQTDKGLLRGTEIWAYQVYSAVLCNAVVDISPVVDQKAKLIAVYKSQNRSRDWGHFALGLNAWNSRWLSTKGKEAWAEAFHVLPAEDYLQWCMGFENLD